MCIFKASFVFCLSTQATDDPSSKNEITIKYSYYYKIGWCRSIYIIPPDLTDRLHYA